MAGFCDFIFGISIPILFHFLVGTDGGSLSAGDFAFGESVAPIEKSFGFRHETVDPNWQSSPSFFDGVVDFASSMDHLVVMS